MFVCLNQQLNVFKDHIVLQVVSVCICVFAHVCACVCVCFSVVCVKSEWPIGQWSRFYVLEWKKLVHIVLVTQLYHWESGGWIGGPSTCSIHMISREVSELSLTVFYTMVAWLRYIC